LSPHERGRRARPGNLDGGALGRRTPARTGHRGRRPHHLVADRVLRRRAAHDDVPAARWSRPRPRPLGTGLVPGRLAVGAWLEPRRLPGGPAAGTGRRKDRPMIGRSASAARDHARRDLRAAGRVLAEAEGMEALVDQRGVREDGIAARGLHEPPRADEHDLAARPGEGERALSAAAGLVGAVVEKKRAEVLGARPAVAVERVLERLPALVVEVREHALALGTIQAPSRAVERALYGPGVVEPAQPDMDEAG